MKHFIICFLIAITACFTASASAWDNTAPWAFSAGKFNPMWLTGRFYPIPAVGAWVSPNGYVGDDCISWDTDPVNYWNNHIHYANQRCQVVSMFQVCTGETGGQWKAIISYNDFGTVHYIHWRGDSLPLW